MTKKVALTYRGKNAELDTTLRAARTNLSHAERNHQPFTLPVVAGGKRFAVQTPEIVDVKPVGRGKESKESVEELNSLRSDPNAFYRELFNRIDG